MSMQFLVLSSSGSFVHANLIYFYVRFLINFSLSGIITLWSEDAKVVKKGT